jgi:hypothetical protein
MAGSIKIREDKSCLNCGARVEARFCSECGQLNTEPRLRLRDVFMDAIRLLTNFDGKFFKTVQLLITRPGYLSTAFLNGKRAGYLPPVQMYFFTSAVFFFVLYTFFVKSPEKSSIQNEVNVKQKPLFELTITDKAGVMRSFEDTEAYFNHQDSLPADRRDGLLTRFLNSKQIKWSKKFSEDQAGALAELIDIFIKGFSNVAFLSLPALAFILYLIFIRRRNFGYVHHTIFLLHLYVFYFIMVMLNFLLKSPAEIEGWGFMHFPAALVILWIIYYGYRAFVNFYQLSAKRALLNYLLFLFFGFIMLSVVYIGYFLASVLFA